MKIIIKLVVDKDYFQLNLQPIIDFLNLPTNEIILRLLILFGWIPVVFLIIWMGKELWLKHIRGQWFSQIKFVLLAIDIPRGNEQSARAVENIFTYFSGAHSSPDLAEKYWIGKKQLSFSFEIVSIEGYTQFLIRSPEIYRNMAESAVYSQYPDAEITEVKDYIDTVPDEYPNDTHNIWGTEVVPVVSDVYPIRTYPAFEDAVSGEFKDPLASLLETMSKIQIILY
jgi:hypothetical protein